MAQVSKSEKRKEQNRRAQANHRKKKQQRLRYLEERVGFLDDHVQTRPAGHVTTSQFAETYEREDCDLLNPPITPFDDAVANLETDFPPACLLQGPVQPRECRSHIERLESQSNVNADVEPRNTLGNPFWYTFDALASNARLIGLSNEALIKSVSESSFFSPLSSLDYSSFPESLRPTMAQLTYQHHPYVDCIPLPDLRSRIILAVNHSPPLICQMDIWTDILLGGIFSGPEPTDGSTWTFSKAFSEKWKALLCYDMGTLLAQTVSSNPPLRIILPP